MALLMFGCTVAGEESEYDDVLAIADFNFALADSNKLSTRGVISRDNIKDYTSDEDIIAFYSDDYYTNKTLLIDKDTVLIEREPIFQSVKGYVVSRGEKSLANTTLEPVFGYATNSTHLDSEIKTDRDDLKLYSYMAGQ